MPSISVTQTHRGPRDGLAERTTVAIEVTGSEESKKAFVDVACADEVVAQQGWQDDDQQISDASATFAIKWILENGLDVFQEQSVPRIVLTTHELPLPSLNPYANHTVK